MLNLYTYLPEETVIGVKAGNGLVSTMPYKTVIAKSGFGYFAGNGFKATTAEPVSIISGHISSETRLQEKPRNIPSWEFRGFSNRALKGINRASKRLRKPSEALVHCQFVSCASYPSFVFQAICAYG